MSTLSAVILFLVFLPVVASAAPVTVNAVGDIMLAGSGEKTFRQFGYDYPFAATAATLRQADIVIGNLEAPIARSGVEFTGKQYRFRLSPETAPALKKAGFTHLSLANNHILDFGSNGLQQTRDALAAQGLAFAGAGPDLAAARRMQLTTVRGVRIAFLSYSLVFPEEFFAAKGRGGTAPGYPALFSKDIAAAKKAADYVIVSFHWGDEGLDRPKPYQVAVGHGAIDAGADIVIGHHPHVLQGVEYYRSGVIFYSLGNFAFGSMSSRAESMIARITLDGGIKEVEVIPVNVRNREVRFQPRLLSGQRREEAVTRLNRLSREMGAVISTSADRSLVARDTKDVASR